MTRTAKAVILARGLGSRMRSSDGGDSLDAAQSSVADTGMKGMIPIGRPFLDYVMSALADAGITDICLVIGPEHDLVRRYYGGEVPLERVRVHFAIQAEPLGTADAVAASADFAAGDHVLVLNADNYYPVRAFDALASLGASGLVGFGADALVAESNIPAERVRRFALVEHEKGWLTNIVEKPDEITFARLAGHALVSMNLWSFSPVIFESCARVRPSSRGELELQDAVRLAMQEFGEPFRVIPCDAGVLDLSSRRDIAAVTERLAAVEVVL